MNHRYMLVVGAASRAEPVDTRGGGSYRHQHLISLIFRYMNEKRFLVQHAMALAALLTGSLAFAQSNLGYLRDAPSGKFNAQDFELFWAAVDEVSRGKTAGVTKSWNNAATGSGGTIKLLNLFTSTDGRDCRRLRVENYAKSLKGASTQNVCAHTDGTWLLDADARPATKP